MSESLISEHSHDRSAEAVIRCQVAQGRVSQAFSDFETIAFSFHEREILEHHSRGFSPKEIAQTLEIAVSTANARLRHLCRKAGVDSHERLIVYVMQQPQALLPHTTCRRGIHQVSPGCPCAHCRAVLAA